MRGTYATFCYRTHLQQRHTAGTGRFNGDGNTDLLCGAPINVLYLSTGTGFVAAGAPPFNATADRVVTGDWNGDGKIDLLIKSTVYLSTGTGFTTPGTGFITLATLPAGLSGDCLLYTSDAA